MPHELTFKLTNFVQNNYHHLRKTTEQVELFMMLPPSLRDEILMTAYGKIIEQINFFNEMEDADFLWRLLPLLRQMRLEKNEILYWNGDISETSKIF